MAALAELRSLGFDATHAATYVDPATSKMRAYDIRARWFGAGRSIRLAVECKNLKPSAPLLVHATPRAMSESFVSVVARYRIGGSLFQDLHAQPNVYEADEPVADRWIDREGNGRFKSTDSATYDKWFQAVNGCYDLVKELAFASLTGSAPR